MPLPTPKGGCGGSHRQACATLINGLMDHVTGADQSKTDTIQQEEDMNEGTSEAHGVPSQSPSHRRFHPHSCWRELLQSLQVK